MGWMTASWRRVAPWILGAAMALGLAACGGGDGNGGAGNTVSLSGVAATGDAIPHATVKVVNANGVTATAVTAADGSFTITVTEGAPYLLSVTDAQGTVWYSYAAAASTRANLTPLTTLALLHANQNRPLADLLAAWASSPLAENAVLEAAKVVNANLQAVMQANGVDATQVNVFTQAFSANRTGLDAVLDAMRVTINCSASACTQTIDNPAGQVLVTWNASIATGSISISWSGGAAGGGGTINVSLGACTANPTAGSYSMVVQTSVAGLAGVTVPDVCVDGLAAKPASQAEFCNDASFQQQLPPGVSILSCSWADPTATITARITQQGLTIDYTVRYTFVRR